MNLAARGSVSMGETDWYKAHYYHKCAKGKSKGRYRAWGWQGGMIKSGWEWGSKVSHQFFFFF